MNKLYKQLSDAYRHDIVNKLSFNDHHNEEQLFIHMPKNMLLVTRLILMLSE